LIRDRAELQAWYRTAMLKRIDELRALRPSLQAGEERAFDAARAIGQALRGSGATFGFPEVTAVATLLETSSDAEVLRRVEGLVSELQVLAASREVDGGYHAEWLLAAADLPFDSDVLRGATDVAEAWSRVAEVGGLVGGRLTAAVARYLDLDVADVTRPSRSALRLVPEALMAAGRIVPLAESSRSITVATSEPTSLAMELELRRLTGRAARFVVAAPDDVERALAIVLEKGTEGRRPVRPVAEPRDVGDTSVLVVDDEPSQRLMVRALLEKGGFGVLEAGNGLEALDRMREDAAVGLVVADLNMPEMDGLELLWELRAEPRWARLPVIVVTGEFDEVLEMQLLEEGADDYVRKPVDARLLLARVEATIRRCEV
jgi:CheY-like chemotaxis protein